MTGTRFPLELNPRLPRELARLDELAADLHYAWDPRTRSLFHDLDAALWERCGHNPTLFLRRVAQARLDTAARDRSFLEAYHRTLANYDTYVAGQPGAGPAEHDPHAPVAYLCAEFGLHESLPIYSGGLGILAGDLCKAASDLCLPFIAIGLLYRFGNFVQEIDEHGQQHLQMKQVREQDLPLERARDASGQELLVTVPCDDGEIAVRAWWARVGHTRLLLLDTDCAGNDARRQCLTHHLYPGDHALRLRQEMVLGIGGVLALAALGIEPVVWHINEGHPALSILARIVALTDHGFTFDAALERVRAATVFTTHTPVAAGHEIYPRDAVLGALGGYLARHGIDAARFLELGANGSRDDFSLTAFALRASGHANGVSAMHGEVAARMEAHLWPQVAPDENPIGHVTNGVHVPTFLAREWTLYLHDVGWQRELGNPHYWEQTVGALAPDTFWAVRRLLKRALIAEIRDRVRRRGERLGWSAAQVAAETAVLDRCEDVLLIGFARRFAAYKRATLLLEDRTRLARLLGDPARPVVIVYAGRAHQSDAEGQALIRAIHALAGEPAFSGRVILLEGYDLALGRRLVSGVDVWVNTPEFPLEASGTSGMKAAINGVLNVSIADGWWREGYTGDNGWSIEPHPSAADAAARRHLEAGELMDLLEQEVVPLYYERRESLPMDWIARAKASMISVLPRFNAERMLLDYDRDHYRPAALLAAALRGDEAAAALAAWRERVRLEWAAVGLALVAPLPERHAQGEPLRITVAVTHPGLTAGDIAVECLVEDGSESSTTLLVQRLVAGDTDATTTPFTTVISDGLAGLLGLRIRAYPVHPHLSHPFEMGLMTWL
ncbi:MAG: alpha-glucan family phosphorylase [Gammaproteobacteria bacterium]